MSVLPRILVVDDEPQIQRFLKPALTASDFQVLTAATAREALRLVATRAPDLIVLDLGLPDADGKQVIRDARAISAAPIIVLSARGQEDEKIAALDLGADDYVEKPFGIGELLARIRTALRHRTGAADQAPAEQDFGPLHIDRLRRLVSRDGEAIHLTPKEYDVLVQLADHAGRVLTHRQLLGAVWGPAHVEDVQYLRVVVAQLRAKIEADPARPQLLVNEPAVGYRLVQP
jgi:two-component system KDP operon response regulator KdpE